MPVYEDEQYELHAMTYRVEADDPADAIIQLLDGEAEAIDNSLDFIEVADERGMLVEDHPELADKLRTLGVPVDDRIIPSIRIISEIESEALSSLES